MKRNESYSLFAGGPLWLICVVVVISIFATHTKSQVFGGIIHIGSRKQLFIDRRFIEISDGIVLMPNGAEKKEICLRADETEDGHQFMITSVLEVDGEYWMYYCTFRTALPPEVKGFNRHVTRLATSKDGIHWNRERVGLIDIGQGLDNNIVMTGSYGIFFVDPKKTDGCTFWWLGNVSERPEWPESKGAFYRTGPRGHREGGVYLCRSQDGRKWERIEEPILPFGCDTRNQGLYDPRIDRYVAYLRARPSGDHCRSVARAESDVLVGAWPFKHNPDRAPGPHGLFDEIRNELPIVMSAAKSDPPLTGIYSPNVHIYPWADNVYLAFPEVYRVRDRIDSYGRDERGREGTVNEGPLDIAVAGSRDGIAWHRFHTPYVRLGFRGEVDSGTMYMGVGMIRRGAEIWQYSSVSPLTHHGRFKRLPGTEGGIRRLVQRLDGFVSADATPDGGEITTPLFLFSGSRLQLNVDCSALGEVWVEILDEEGRPVPGYTMDEAVSVDMNGVAEEVWWRHGPDLNGLAGKPIRLHFRMRSAKLFSFQFVDGPEVRGR